MVLQIGNENWFGEIDLPELYSNYPDLVSAGSKFASIPYRSVQVRFKSSTFDEKPNDNLFSY